MRGDAEIVLCEEFEYFISGDFCHKRGYFYSDLLRPRQHKFHSNVKCMRTSAFVTSYSKDNSKLLKTE